MRDLDARKRVPPVKAWIIGYADIRVLRISTLSATFCRMHFIWIIPTVIILGLVLYNALAWPPVTFSADPVSDHVSILIPARDEAQNLPALFESLRDQTNVEEILVYDDHSTDGTPDLVTEWSSRDPRIRLVSPLPLPADWGGKPFACHTLAEKAGSEWLLFLDADARLKPNAVVRILNDARKRNVTLLACWPGLIAESIWEKMFMPMLNFSVFTLFPAPLSLERQQPSLGLAHGACLLLRREDYLAIGGHSRVRKELFEDTILARVWRESGRPGICLDGQDVIQTRMYDSLPGIWQGFEKIFYPAFRSDRNFWFFLLFHLLLFLLPFLLVPVLIVVRQPFLPWLACALMVLSMRLALAFRFRQSLWPILFHPVAEATLLVLGCSSRHRYRSGRGVTWKGRAYSREAS